jgi:hypothetical protein
MTWRATCAGPYITDLAFSFLSASFVRIIRLFRVSRMFRLIKSLKAGGLLQTRTHEFSSVSQV